MISSTIILNLENIHKLNTKEDSTFLHKYLGFLCLSNFIYRYAYYFTYGNMNLNNIFSMFLVFVHGLLSISSFIFHIPNIRNPLKPMIYPEFRMHSIVFAMRGVICCWLFYFNYHYIHRIIICYMTFVLADMTSSYYNKNGKNGKTMRNMPFDSSIRYENQQQVTKMHSVMQIGATTYMLGNIDSAFSPLFAIQLAAFLMTLVRKSIISTTTWHAIYSFSLWINFYLFANLPISYIIINQMMMGNYIYFFFPYKVNKYIAWTTNFGMLIVYKETRCDIYIDNTLSFYNNILFQYKLLFISLIFGFYLLKYRFLFIR